MDTKPLTPGETRMLDSVRRASDHSRSRGNDGWVDARDVLLDTNEPAALGWRNRDRRLHRLVEAGHLEQHAEAPEWVRTPTLAVAEP